MLIIISYIGFSGFIRLITLNSTKKKSFIYISGATLFIIAALRSVYFGSDPIGYVLSYRKLSYQSLSSLWFNLINYSGKDPFFSFFSKILNMSGVSAQLWLAILSGIFIFSVSKLIYKYSDEPYISYISLISLGYFYFSLTGLRQATAIAIILLSYKYLRERKLLNFILFVLFASLFHASALIFLIAYPISQININIKQIIGIISALMITIYFSSFIRQIIRYIAWTETIASYADRQVTLNYSGFIIQFAIFIFCWAFKDKVLEKDHKNITLYNLLFLGLVFQSFSTIVAEFFRVSYYFSIFNIILIPKAIDVIDHKGLKMYVYLVILSIFIIYFLRSGSFQEFAFFWEQPFY